MNSAPIWKLLEAQGNLRQLPSGAYIVSCPGPSHTHGDRNPSLSVGVKDDGRVVLYCHAGCQYDDIMAALGAAWRDQWPDGSPPGEKRFQARDRNGKSHGSHRRYYNSDGEKQGGWAGNDRGATKMPLYGAEKLKDLPSGGRIYLTEGEPPCEALWKRNVAAVGTMTGAGAIPCDDSLRDLRKFTVILWPDNDDVGRRHMEKIAERLTALGIPYLWLDWPDAPLKADAVEYFAFGGTVGDLEALIRDTPREKAPTLLGISMADVTPEEIRWLWHQRIALGKITMFDGDGGVGKSLVTLDLAARVAMARPMPDGSPGLDARAGVVVICGEDGLADTVMPRLMAAGVSPEALRPVRAINLVPEPLADGTISERLISLMRDIPALEATITAIGAKLLIVDPLTAYLGDGVDAYKDSEVRRVLTPLALMAERTGIAVVLVRHLNRSTGANAQHRGLGSVAFLNLARLGLLFAPNPDAEGEYLLSRYKGNIGKPPPTMGYSITQIGDAENMPKVKWLGEKETSAEAGLAAVSGSDRSETRTATDDAEEWLKDRLSGGPQPVKSLIIEAIRDGIIPDEYHDKPLRTARERVCDKPYREGGIGGAGKWVWRLLPPGAGHLSENGPDEQATNPESNSARAKMPSREDSGHLSEDSATKMPSDDNTGHLSTNPEFNGDNAASESPIWPKMPSPEEPIGSGHVSVGPVNSGHLSADTRETPPADVVAQPERTCSHCGRHKFFTDDDGVERCEMCWEPLATTDAPTPPPPTQEAPEEPQRRVWRRAQVQERTALYD
jgi:hypothetical protein